MVGRKPAGQPDPIPQENPGWLLTDPEGASPPPPVQPRSSMLPFGALVWKDFERLCRRLAERDGKVEQASAYGTEGQAQYGIDILVRLTDGGYEVWQTKRYRDVKPSNVHSALRLFLKHKWATKATKLVLVFACRHRKEHAVTNGGAGRFIRDATVPRCTRTVR
jgi:hypothetical protein